MLEQEHVPDLVADLERRIDAMQNMGDAELGRFTRVDWTVLILISIVIPAIVIWAVR